MNKTRTVLLLLTFLSVTPGMAQLREVPRANPLMNGGVPEVRDTAQVRIIPAPACVVKYPGTFTFDAHTIIVVDPAIQQECRFLEDYLKQNTHWHNKIQYSRFSDNGNVHTFVTADSNIKPDSVITHDNADGPTVIITAAGAEKLPESGYRLRISATGITLTGRGAGLFYGIQSLIQLFPVEAGPAAVLPCVEIVDQPRFAYRGMMLDVSRHFFSVGDVKKVIDLMARYKLNNFHWHLTDNQGWRIAIKKYPLLTTVGSNRWLTKFHDNRDWLDSVPYGGFYTREDIREVVAYATQRHINIIPEIEMPGHSQAALRAYPALKCQAPAGVKNNDAYEVLYRPSEETFRFLEDVLSEVAELFPGKYIHIGGDEVNTAPWKNDPLCRQLIRDRQLKDEHGLQGYFIQRIGKFLQSKGKQLIGWDEMLDSGLPPEAVLMSWRSEEGGIAAARLHHPVIMSPEPRGMYFDVYQSTSATEPVNRWGYAPLELTYGYDPLPVMEEKNLNRARHKQTDDVDSLPALLTADEQRYILGVQANIWTEWIATPAKLQYMILPRMLALAEVAWSPVHQKDFKRFYNDALPTHLARLEQEGFNYRVPPAAGVRDTMMIGADFTFALSTIVPGAKIYYTLNGRIPDDTDLEYTGPLHFLVPENEKRELRTLVITPGGRRSIASRTVMYNRSPAPPVAVVSPQNGIGYTLLSGHFNDIGALACGTVKARGISTAFDIAAFRKAGTPFGLIYEGFIRIDNTGIYNFSLASVDASQLFIDSEMVADNAVPHVRFDRTGAMPLMKGYHRIRLTYLDTGKPKYLLKLVVTGPNNKKEDLSRLLCYASADVVKPANIAADDTVAPGPAILLKNPIAASLPRIYDSLSPERIGPAFMAAAAEKAAAIHLPEDKPGWEKYRHDLKEKIIKSTRVLIDHQLPLRMQQTGVVKQNGYEIRNIFFQTRPGVYATANLFVPDGKGPFPAVITMSGHSPNGRLYEKYQAVGQTLALNGYVSLNIDPWGAGERTTTHGVFEYHGANIGASLMDIGETLMGMQLTDNIRGVDLLASLPFVDNKNIGATGASGGGNQTMYLAALDERVKAAVPVVSVGTFESYVMRNNCICELLPDGLTYTEEAGLLAMVAPRAIKMCNGNKDSNPTFFPSEMLRSFNKARPVFETLGAGNNIRYQVFDLPHGYEQQDREAMLGWFNLHLKGKGDGSPAEEKTLQPVTEAQLMVFAKGQRDAGVKSTVAFCEQQGVDQQQALLSEKVIRTHVKQQELRNILRRKKAATLKKVDTLAGTKDWDRFVLELTDGQQLPLLHRAPGNGAGYTIICHPGGKDSIDPVLINECVQKGMGIVIVDLPGTGENNAAAATAFDAKLVPFHTLSRTSLWLGKTVMGQWVTALQSTLFFLRQYRHAATICIDGAKECGLAALFLSVLTRDADQVILRDAPLSYLLSGGVTDYYSMAIHLPGIIGWGDVVLAAAMSRAQATFITPRTISGSPLGADALQQFNATTALLKQRLR